MHRCILILAFVASLCGTFDAQQPSSHAPLAADRSGLITGVWRADMNGMPAVALVVTNEGGPISGAVLFYLQIRKDVRSPYTVTAGLPEPMLKPNFDGTTLRFEVSHRRAHPPGSLNDPPMPFHLKLTGSDKAELVNEREGFSLPVTRSAY